MNIASRVRHLDHPEYGFGTIKLFESDPLDDREIIQVAFDWCDGTISCSRDRLIEIEVIADGRIIPATSYGSIKELRSRMGSALILSENARTSGFSRSFITPLPHQAYLLEKVHGQRHLGHLIADDVGMGKTIEAGLIISAERQINPKLRVLILAPKNVILQWQDEMEEHFGLFFRVAKRDFEIRQPNHWTDIDLVIASRDGLKQTKYREVLTAIESFDLIVIDEAHALTARRDFLSGDIERTGNYRFAEWLSAQHIVNWECDQQGAPRSPRFLFLTATPHQGDDTRFLHLLSLVRPDLIDVDQDNALSLEIETLKACVSRTAKKKAVDWEGRPIFKGHESRTIDISLSDAEQHILGMLSWYVRERMVFKATGRAEALIRALAMHTYQKIAASSWQALESSLVSRLEGRIAEPDSLDEESLLEYDLLGGDNEIQALNELLALVRNLKDDTKGKEFAKLFHPSSGFRSEGDKVLVFTQYRSTQEYLRSTIEKLGLKVAFINGSLSIDQRREQRAYFEDCADVMISTEAGSEGANLHKKCHLLINYDSPWNPMRLLQRVGRLDRYGQKHKVTAITLRTPQTWDSEISRKIETKLATIQSSMGQVSDEDYRDMIIGAVYDAIDVGSIMAAADWDLKAANVDCAIDDEIAKAREDRNRLKRLLSDSVGMPEGFEAKRSEVGSKEFQMAFKWAAENQEIMLRETRTRESKYLQGVYHFTLPENFRMLLRASRECYVVFDRDRFSEVRGEVLGRARGQEIKPILAGIGEPVTDWFMNTAISADANPVAFSLASEDDNRQRGKFWVAFMARWRSGSKGPDYMGLFEIDPIDGSATEIPTNRVFQDLENATPHTAQGTVRLPDFSAARKAAQVHVTSMLERSPSMNRNNLRFGPWLVIQWV